MSTSIRVHPGQSNIPIGADTDSSSRPQLNADSFGLTDIPKINFAEDKISFTKRDENSGNFKAMLESIKFIETHIKNNDNLKKITASLIVDSSRHYHIGNSQNLIEDKENIDFTKDKFLTHLKPLLHSSKTKLTQEELNTKISNFVEGICFYSQNRSKFFVKPLTKSILAISKELGIEELVHKFYNSNEIASPSLVNAVDEINFERTKLSYTKQHKNCQNFTTMQTAVAYMNVLIKECPALEEVVVDIIVDHSHRYHKADSHEFRANRNGNEHDENNIFNIFKLLLDHYKKYKNFEEENLKTKISNFVTGIRFYAQNRSKFFVEPLTKSILAISRELGLEELVKSKGPGKLPNRMQNSNNVCYTVYYDEIKNKIEKETEAVKKQEQLEWQQLHRYIQPVEVHGPFT